MNKKCNGCSRDLAATGFSRLGKSPDGLQPRCKDCVKAYYRSHRETLTQRSARWFREHPRQSLNSYLKRTYKITADEYDNLLVKQGGRCAVCKTSKPSGMGRWHVDHDHSTGRVRGLLCQRCNTGLGKLGDDPLKAANMLARYAIITNAN